MQLHADIVRHAEVGVRGETPPEQSARVRKLQHAEKQRRLQDKKMRSMTKAWRRGKA